MLYQLSYAPNILFAVGSFSLNMEESAMFFFLFLKIIRKCLDCVKKLS
jgi:hypothetical protein